MYIAVVIVVRKLRKIEDAYSIIILLELIFRIVVC